MSERTPRIVTEVEASKILRKGGSQNATGKAVRWLTQREGAPSRPDFLVDLDELADYLRKTCGETKRGIRVVAKLFDKVVPRGAKPRALTAEELKARQRGEKVHQDIGSELDRALTEVNWERRTRAEHDLLFFLEAYCTGGTGALLEVPPPQEMQPIVRNMEQAIGDSSIPYHIRVARGHGKTSYTKGAAQWVTAIGRRRYIIVAAANSENAENIIDDVFTSMTTSPAFVADFPEIALPFVRLCGAYQRAKTQMCHGRPTECARSANKIVLPTVTDPRTGEPFPSSGAIIEAVGFSSSVRGKAKMSARPDLVILDDLQNDERAKSDMQVAKMASKIKKSFLGLAGHRKKLAVIMTSTPIEVDDLSETFAADPGWKTKTYKMMPSWPRCHNPELPGEKKPADLWERYWEVYCAEMLADRKPYVAANEFYREHRAEMDDGAVVLNPYNYDPAEEVSAIQHAMNILFRDGMDTFMSEYQMRPPRDAFAFELSARLILSRVLAGSPAKHIPQSTTFVAAATDVNPGYAITTAIVCFDVEFTGFVTAYHVRRVKIPDSLNDVEFAARVHEELVAAGKEIAEQGIDIDAWGVDAGGRNFRAVTRFCSMSESLCGIKATAMLGRAGQNWNPNVRSRIRKARNDTVLCQDGNRNRWLAWDADAWKERMQKAWGTAPGGLGGLTLFDGKANHSKFAAQVANEKLVEKRKVKSWDGREKYAYRWKTREPHDYGDALAMCFALAGSEGIGGERRVEPAGSLIGMAGGDVLVNKPAATESRGGEQGESLIGRAR